MKVYPFKITKPLGENLIVQVDRSSFFYNQLHQHEEIQLSLIVRGRGKLIVGDSVHPFSAGNFFTIGPNSPHLFRTEATKDTVEMISLFFTKETFGEHFFNLPDLDEISSFFDDAQNGFKLAHLNKEVQRLMITLPISDKFTRFISLMKLLRILCTVDKTSLTSFIYTKKIGSKEGKRMQTIFDFTMNNFQNEITLEKASELVYMTPNAFCRFFKQRTNKTFFQFLIELRVEHACQLLRNKKDLSIGEISNQSGFNSISNFNRKFKVLKKIRPLEYSRSFEV